MKEIYGFLFFAAAVFLLFQWKKKNKNTAKKKGGSRPARGKKNRGTVARKNAPAFRDDTDEADSFDGDED